VSFLGGHILTIDGQVVGGWTRMLKGQKLIVDLKGAASFDAAERRAIAKEAERFGVFLGTPAELAQHSA
jgi:hypothetical protein